MKKILLSATVLILLVGIFLFVTPSKQPPTSLPPAPSEQPPPEPPIKYPLAPSPVLEPPPAAPQDAVQPPAPAPRIQPETDQIMTQLLDLLKGRKSLIELLQPDHFIQRFVVTIDNLPRPDLPRRQLPTKGASGLFLVQGEKDHEVISPYNSRRYTPFVELAESLDSRQLVDIYVRNYPLFQKAYTDLGNPSSYFNDRLVEAIDHLLATPQVQEPIRLERPGVLYKFADPDLESLSAGQKLMLRIGKDNAAKIKAKLSELRAELVKRTLRP